MACSICSHALVADIDESLKKVGPRQTSRAFNISKTTLLRHGKGCLGQAIATEPPSVPVTALVLPPAPAVVPSPERAPNPTGKPGAGRPCETCRCPVREEIERKLCDGMAWKHISDSTPGASSYDSIRYHATNCVPDMVRLARAESGAAKVASMAPNLDILRDSAMALVADAEALMHEARKAYDLDPANIEAQQFAIASARTVGDSLGKAKSILEVVGKLTGETNVAATDIRKSPDWPAFTAAISEAVADCEGCSLAVEVAVAGVKASR